MGSNPATPTKRCTFKHRPPGRCYALVQELQSHRDVLEATSDLVVMLSAEAIDFLM